MLKKIEQEDIDKLDETQRQNLMVNAEGEYVFAQADEKAWKKHLEQVKASEAAQKNQQVGDKELRDRGLECPIDKRLFVDPMKTPCCGKTYCHDCIENALLENDLTCPGCETENISLERLEPDEDMKAKIKEYEASKNPIKQRSRSPTVADSPAQTPAAGSRPGSRDGSSTPHSVTGSAKKRTASDATATSGLAAPAMKRQKSGDAVTTPQAEDAKSVTSSTPEVTNALPANMMPPDFSQMQQNGMNMPMMAGFNPMLMMQMAMNQGNGMNPMNFMNPMMMNGMNGNPQNMNMNNMGYPNQNQNWNGNMNMNQMPFPNQNFPQNNFNNNNRFNHRPQRNFQKNNNFRNGNGAQANPPPNAPTQPAGLTNVPTGPKALQNKAPAQPHNQGNNFYPPTGPGAGGKFSNQQRYAGNDEDNAYMRQPVNPGRSFRGKKLRDAEFREL
jgi:protein MPE1